MRYRNLYALSLSILFLTVPGWAMGSKKDEKSDADRRIEADRLYNLVFHIGTRPGRMKSRQPRRRKMIAAFFWILQNGNTNARSRLWNKQRMKTGTTILPGAASATPIGRRGDTKKPSKRMTGRSL